MPKAEYKSAVRSRKKIREALADLLQEKPLDKITVTDVVKKAEINRGTFYAHYSDIPDVIHKLTQESFARFRDALPNVTQQLQDITEVLLDQIQEILEEDLDLYRKIMASSAAIFMQQQIVQMVRDYLLEREMDGEDRTRFLLTICFGGGGLSALYVDWLCGKIPLSLTELTYAAKKMLSDMLERR